MFEIIGLLLALIFSITGLQTLLFYVIWFYDRQVFPEQAEVAGEGNEILLLPALGAVVMEWLSISVLVVTYPLRLIHDASPPVNRKEGETPVILVHGYGGDSANFLYMQWRLKRRGWNNVYAVSYTPPTINARKLAQQVANHVERIRKATGAPQVNLVCHSMGGPLTRYALHHLGLSGKVNRVITLGSPHAGSRIASLFPVGGAASQMQYQSPFIQELSALDPTPGGAVFYSIYSNFDNFVVPASTAVLGGNAININVPYHGHCRLLYSDKVLDLVEGILRDGRHGSGWEALQQTRQGTAGETPVSE